MKVSTLFTILVTLAAFGGASADDKSRYHLLNPVPNNLLRELVGDRPDGTESPTTVDAGHFQIETSFVDFQRNRDSGAQLDVITAGATNVRVGLLNDLELQVLFDIHTREETKLRGFPTQTTEGFSDITLRPKLNLQGNDGGSTALAIMPAVKIPTGSDLSNGEVEGAIILPFGIDLTDRLGLGLMAEVDWVYDGEDDDYDTELFHTAVLGYDLTDVIGIYAEYIGIASEAAYQPHLSCGATLAVSENAALDLGAVFGLNDHTNDLQVFTGITIRF